MEGLSLDIKQQEAFQRARAALLWPAGVQLPSISVSTCSPLPRSLSDSQAELGVPWLQGLQPSYLWLPTVSCLLRHHPFCPRLLPVDGAEGAPPPCSSLPQSLLLIGPGLPVKAAGKGKAQAPWPEEPLSPSLASPSPTRARVPQGPGSLLFPWGCVHSDPSLSPFPAK